VADVIAMSQSCSKCGATVTNDDPAIQHPLDFLQALRERGWQIASTQFGAQSNAANKPTLCARCASSL
jgi:hypothetical protein